MADLITTGTSGYQTGSIDSATTLVNGVSPRDAKHVNGVASAAVQIETILGVGTDLKGSAADLVARLATEHNADGTQKTLITGRGGTGVTTLTDGGVLVGNGTGAVQTVAVPSAPKVLIHSGSAATDPFWGSGLFYQGPSSIGTGSTRSLETFTSATGNLSGIHFYDGAFTLNSGHTLTVPAGGKRLIIISNTSITINGTITAAGAGGTGRTQNVNGDDGTDQPGGGGGGSGGSPGGSGGAVLCNGVVVTQSGGTGVAGTQQTASAWNHALFGSMGGSGGGGGHNGGVAGGTGGNGGGSIVLIAPVITLGSTAVLNTTGGNGANGNPGFDGGGGGGGGGNVTIVCRSYTDSGATFTLTGGSAGTGLWNGGAGAAGVKQILIYA